MPLAIELSISLKARLWFIISLMESTQKPLPL